MRFLLCCLFAVALNARIAFSDSVSEIYQWNNLTFDLASQGIKTPNNAILSDIKYWNGYYYVAVPHLTGEIPATLARFADDSNIKSPKLEPYPKNMDNTCLNNLYNVQSIQVDSTGNLWILDLGQPQTTNCGPKLVIQNTTESELKTAVKHDLDARYIYYDFVVDGEYAYITANITGKPAIVVYKKTQSRRWEFKPNNVTIAPPTETQTNNINIGGIAINQDTKTVYFSFSSAIYSITTQTLQNGAFSGNIDAVITKIGDRSSESMGMIMDTHGVLYYGLKTGGIASWDSTNTLPPFEYQTISVENNDLLPYSFTTGKDGTILVLMNRMNQLIGKDKKDLDLTKVNLRLLKIKDSQLTTMPTSQQTSDATTNQAQETTSQRATEAERNEGSNSEDGTANKAQETTSQQATEAERNEASKSADAAAKKSQETTSQDTTNQKWEKAPQVTTTPQSNTKGTTKSNGSLATNAQSLPILIAVTWLLFTLSFL